MSGVLEGWRRFWFGESCDYQLGWARIVVLLYLMRFHVDSMSSWRWLASIPADFYEPSFFARLFGFPVPVPLPVAEVLARIAGVAWWFALLGVLTRVSLFAFAAIYLVRGTVQYSMVWTHHDAGIGGLCALILVFAPGTDDWSVDAIVRACWRRSRNPQAGRPWFQELGWGAARPVWPQRLVLLMLAMSYTGAGINKVRYGGPRWLDGRTLQYYLSAKRLRPRTAMHYGMQPVSARTWKDPWGVDAHLYNPRPTQLARRMSKSIWLCRGMAAATLIFECGFVASAFWIRRAGWFLAAALCFHMLTKLTLSVFFWGNVACFPVAMRCGRWPQLARRGWSRARSLLTARRR